MNQKELKDLIEFLIEKDIAEFELERGDVKVKVIRTGRGAAVSVAPEVRYVQAAPAVAHVPSSAPGVQEIAERPASPASSAAADEDLFIVKSPIVGTFYESPSPGSPPFFKVGDHVDMGQILCIIEAMKLMNEIESDASGVIVKRMVNNGQPVEYGQPLFAIRTSK
jgi:acetyl-CoA carboxylase biotin carboxyl carrier protein